MPTIPHNLSVDYVIQTTGAIEEAFGNLEVVSARVYVHGAVTSGVPAAAAGDCNIGQVRSLLTELRAVGDESIPYLINETPSRALQPARLFVRGTAGDHVTMVYLPESFVRRSGTGGGAGAGGTGGGGGDTADTFNRGDYAPPGRHIA